VEEERNVEFRLFFPPCENVIHFESLLLLPDSEAKDKIVCAYYNSKCLHPGEKKKFFFVTEKSAQGTEIKNEFTVEQALIKE